MCSLEAGTMLANLFVVSDLNLTMLIYKSSVNSWIVEREKSSPMNSWSRGSRFGSGFHSFDYIDQRSPMASKQFKILLRNTLDSTTLVQISLVDVWEFLGPIDYWACILHRFWVFQKCSRFLSKANLDEDWRMFVQWKHPIRTMASSFSSRIQFFVLTDLSAWYWARYQEEKKKALYPKVQSHSQNYQGSSSL